MKDELKEIKVDLIDPNPYQPRKLFSRQSLLELQNSIQQNGLIQPIVVRAVNNRYQIIAGERRFRAIQALGHPMIPAHIKDMIDEDVRLVAIVENLQRDDLNPVELARAYLQLHSDLGMTQEQISAKLGKDRSTISNTLRLLDLPDELLVDIEQGRLSAGHARALLPLKGSHLIFALRNDIIKKKLSVRNTELHAKKLLRKTIDHPEKITPTSHHKEDEVKRIEKELGERLDTLVEIWGEHEGSIHIKFSSPIDFNRIVTAILEKDDDMDFAEVAP